MVDQGVHIVIRKVMVPNHVLQSKAIAWVTKEYNDELKKTDVVPEMEERVRKQWPGRHKKWREISVALDLTDVQTMAMRSNDSMVADWKRRCAEKPSKKCPKSVYRRAKKPTQFKCPVCLEKKGRVVALAVCGHVYHKKCAELAYRHEPRCPLCYVDL